MKSEKSDGNRPAYQRLLPSDSTQSKQQPQKPHHSPPLQKSTVPVFTKMSLLFPDVIAKGLSLSPTPFIRSAISFALHFGLPLKKETIEGFIAQTVLLPEDLKEAALVATLIACAKGLGLSKAAVAELAALLSPHPGSVKQGQPQKKGEKIPPTSTLYEKVSTNPDEIPDEATRENKAGEVPTDPALIAHYFTETAQKHPLINLLNRFPHHNQQRLFTFPFHFIEKDFTLKGSIRLLCIDNPQGMLEVHSLVLDAATEKHRWYIQATGNNTAKPTITLWIFPPPKNNTTQESIIKSLSTISDTVSVRFENPEPFQDFRAQNYTSFEFHV